MATRRPQGQRKSWCHERCSAPNPELMIIGDSLAQGCRSLTVKQDFCRAVLGGADRPGAALGLCRPRLPAADPVDLEAEIRRLDTGSLSVNGFRFEGLIGRLKENLQGWLANARESAFTCFDNLGLSGALIYDLYTRSAATSAAEIAALTPPGAATPLPSATIGDLHLAINGRFTLNPSQDPAFNDFTPLEWVVPRKPRRPPGPDRPQPRPVPDRVPGRRRALRPARRRRHARRLLVAVADPGVGAWRGCRPKWERSSWPCCPGLAPSPVSSRARAAARTGTPRAMAQSCQFPPRS